MRRASTARMMHFELYINSTMCQLGTCRRAVVVAQVLQDVFRRLSFSGTGFSGHDDGLRLTQDLHVSERLRVKSLKYIILIVIEMWV